MNVTRNGKIARLPQAIRDELNQRLANGERGTDLVTWLNSLPEVQRIIAEQFDGRPMRAQNLSEWKHGGYKDWQQKQEAMEWARQFPAEAAALKNATGELPSEVLANWLTARYAVAAQHREENGEMDWKRLRELCRDVTVLRQNDHRTERLKLGWERLELERQQSEEEMVKQFVRWVKNPKVRELIDAHAACVAQQEQESLEPSEANSGSRTARPTPQKSFHDDAISEDALTRTSSVDQQGSTEFQPITTPSTIITPSENDDENQQVSFVALSQRNVITHPWTFAEPMSRTVQSGEREELRLNPAFEFSSCETQAPRMRHRFSGRGKLPNEPTRSACRDKLSFNAGSPRFSAPRYLCGDSCRRAETDEDSCHLPLQLIEEAAPIRPNPAVENSPGAAELFTRRGAEAPRLKMKRRPAEQGAFQICK